MEPGDVPALPRGVRLYYDRVRETWVLLAPERALTLDAIGHAILAEVDGIRSCHEITACLAARYDAPEDQIASDMAGFLRSLRDRRFVDVVTCA